MFLVSISAPFFIMSAPGMAGMLGILGMSPAPGNANCALASASMHDSPRTRRTVPMKKTSLFMMLNFSVFLSLESPALFLDSKTFRKLSKLSFGSNKILLISDVLVSPSEPFYMYAKIWIKSTNHFKISCSAQDYYPVRST